MATYDLVIRDAKVGTASDTFSCDIGVKDGKIAALGHDLPKGEREIAARGRLVLPGGIDTHIHLSQDVGAGVELADDFTSGTLSAICGGTTTIVPFAYQAKGQSLRAAVKDYHTKSDGKAYGDYAFHLIITDPTTTVLGQELPSLIADGYTSFKLYMTYDPLKLDDRQLLQILSLARREGAMSMIHAENADAINWLTDLLEGTGRIAPKFHAVAHSSIGEGEATHRAISLSELIEVPILIVHVSSREAVEELRRAQSNGLRIFAETCPQYLFLTAADLDPDDGHGARCVCSPPPRDKATQEVLWTGLANGTFSVISSDHSPFNMTAKGKYVCGPAAPFSKIPNGVPGVETRLPLLLSEGVMKGRITLQQFVALTATNPARIYGLAPRKGSIVIGADADLVIWNTGLEIKITQSMLHHATDYTPYEGMTVSAWPDIVTSRGEVVVEGGQPVKNLSVGRGQFLRCERPDAARPRAGVPGIEASVAAMTP
ncbi:MAG: dihydropyrimidinase [Rhodospirillaceae bacterium]